MKLPLTEIGKLEKAGLGMETKSSILGMLGFRYLLDVQEELTIRHLDIQMQSPGCKFGTSQMVFKAKEESIGRKKDELLWPNTHQSSEVREIYSFI